MLKLQSVIKKYGDTIAVNDISFETQKNEITTILGPNGAGKTTILRLISGFLKPNHGQIYIDGENPLSQETRKKIGYLPENNPLYEELNVVDYLLWISDIYKLADKENKVKSVLKKCFLNEVVYKKIGELSKGYKQRLSIAKAIIHEPELIILDEPTSGLDPIQAEEIKNLLRELKKDKSVIMSTHILSEVKDISDKVILINRGKLVLDGKIEDILNKGNFSLKLISDRKDFDYNIFASLGKIKMASEDGFNIFLIESERDIRKEVMDTIISNKLPILEVFSVKQELEDLLKSLML